MIQNSIKLLSKSICGSHTKSQTLKLKAHIHTSIGLNLLDTLQKT